MWPTFIHLWSANNNICKSAQDYFVPPFSVSSSVLQKQYLGDRIKNLLSGSHKNLLSLISSMGFMALWVLSMMRRTGGAGDDREKSRWWVKNTRVVFSMRRKYYLTPHPPLSANLCWWILPFKCRFHHKITILQHCLCVRWSCVSPKYCQTEYQTSVIVSLKPSPNTQFQVTESQVT